MYYYLLLKCSLPQFQDSIILQLKANNSIAIIAINLRYFVDKDKDKDKIYYIEIHGDNVTFDKKLY